MPPDAGPAAMSPEDIAVLERFAGRVVELRMETPAILAIESSRPMSLVAGQAMLFFEPIAQMLFRFPDYRRFAALIERRETLDVLVQLIDHAAQARDRAHRDAKADRDIPTPKA